MGELSPAFSAVPTHKPVKKVRDEAKKQKTKQKTFQVVYAELLCAIAAFSEREPSLHTCIKYWNWIAHSHCSRPHIRTVKQFPALPLRSWISSSLVVVVVVVLNTSSLQTHCIGIFVKIEHVQMNIDSQHWAAERVSCSVCILTVLILEESGNVSKTAPSVSCFYADRYFLRQRLCGGHVTNFKWSLEVCKCEKLLFFSQRLSFLI